MYSIRAHFERFRDVHLGTLFGACGIYVLWDGEARARPTYIGEGNILKRLSDHWTRKDLTISMPLDGYVAIIGDHGHRPSKSDACIVEYLLLEIASATDRSPAINAHPGKRRVLEAMCDRERTVRLAVSGFDPLQAPWEARPLAYIREAKAWLTDDDVLEIHSQWTLRRLRKSASARGQSQES